MEFINMDKPIIHCCRTCLTEGQADMHDIFINIGDSVNAADVLASCTSIKIKEGDFLPKEICTTCYECLTNFYHFRKIAEKINIELNLQLERKERIFNDELEKLKDFTDSNVKVKLEDHNFNDDVEENHDYEDNYDIVKKEAKYEKDSLVCKTCFQLCGNIETLQEHLQIHSITQDDDDVIECDVCLKPFKNLSKYKQHKLKHSQSYKCKFCLSSFKSQKSYAAHMRKHPKIKIKACMVCGKVFNKLSHLIRHELIHPVSETPVDRTTDENLNENQIFTCDLCSSRFKSRNCIVAHMKKHKRKVFSCSHCVKTFRKRNQLKRHELLHEKWSLEAEAISQNYNIEIPIKTELEEVVNHECDVCSERFQCGNSLAAHKRKHTKKNRVLACSICGKEFKKLSHVKRHELCHDVNRPYKCFLCPRRFNSEGLLKDHIEDHNNRKLKPHKCPLCPKAFSYVSTLTSHIKIHTRDKPYLCPTCGKKFDSSTNLKQHVKRHLGLKSFACSLCPKKFVSKGELKSHNVTHSGERSHTCDLCGSTFTKGSSLTKHKLRHLGVKPHHCDVCPMKFSSKDHLQRHYRIHTGEKPYQCNSCDRAFTQSGDLIKHKRSHHGDNLYKCTQCPESFRLNSQLRQHISEHFVSAKLHGDPNKCEVSTKSEPIDTAVSLPEVRKNTNTASVDS